MRKSNFLPFTPITPCQNHLDTRLTAPTPPKITSQKHLASKALKYSAWSLTRYQDLAWYQLWQQVLFLFCLCLSSCLCAFVPVATSVGVRDYPSIFHLTGLHMAVTYGWGFCSVCRQSGAVNGNAGAMAFTLNTTCFVDASVKTGVYVRVQPQRTPTQRRQHLWNE